MVIIYSQSPSLIVTTSSSVVGSILVAGRRCGVLYPRTFGVEAVELVCPNLQGCNPLILFISIAFCIVGVSGTLP